MVWRYEKARSRIKKLIGEAPVVEVNRFADEYMPLYEARRSHLETVKARVSPPLFDLEKGKAVLVDTVQIYIGITNYDEHRIEEGKETEASHERGLRFLHLYYSACDRVVEQTGAQRVDFHGSRMHAVVLDQTGSGVSRESVIDALAFISDFRAVAEQANRELANSELTAQFRMGVDVGSCVAINNGTGLEQEPMFLGSCANYAAKLADGDEPGIYLSDRVRALLDFSKLGALEPVLGIAEDELARLVASRNGSALLAAGASGSSSTPQALVETWRNEVVTKKVPDPSVPRFTFHHKEPPLSEIDYADLTPSNSIRMSLVSIFADLSGYTDFIDEAIRVGNIKEAVQALYVIREEFQSVVEEDFGGRKVRFIGDCIHAVLAEGTKYETDERGSVTQGFTCAGGLRSSFEICQDELGEIDSLGLAIGLELGATPISRIGIRGERSVRLASSSATATSEKMQKECGDNETILGPKAYGLLPASLNDLTDSGGAAVGVTYDDIVTSSSTEMASQPAPAYVRAHSPSDAAVGRAHFRKA